MQAGNFVPAYRETHAGRRLSVYSNASRASRFVSIVGWLESQSIQKHRWHAKKSRFCPVPNMPPKLPNYVNRMTVRCPLLFHGRRLGSHQWRFRRDSSSHDAMPAILHVVGLVQTLLEAAVIEKAPGFSNEFEQNHSRAQAQWPTKPLGLLCPRFRINIGPPAVDYASAVWHNPRKGQDVTEGLGYHQRTALLRILPVFKTIATQIMEIEAYIQPTQLLLKKGP